MIQGTFNEVELQEKLHNGEITRLKYVQHSEEMKREYEDFCKEKGLQQDEQSAQQFMEYLLNQEIEAHTSFLD